MPHVIRVDLPVVGGYPEWRFRSSGLHVQMQSWLKDQYPEKEKIGRKKNRVVWHMTVNATLKPMVLVMRFAYEEDMIKFKLAFPGFKMDDNKIYLKQD